MRHLSIALSSVLLLIVGTLGLSSEISALTYPVGVPTGEIAGGTYRTYFDNIFPGCSAGQVIQSFSAVGVPVCVTPTATGFSILGAALGHTLYYNGSNWVSSTNIFNSGGNVGIGTTTPGAKLEINGQIKITGGTPGAGQVLTSDATGLATWVTPGAASNQVCPGTGLNNTCYGIGAMSGNTTGYNSVAIGGNTLLHNTTGFWNTAVGTYALKSNTTGSNNSAFGANALQANTIGQQNSANSTSALYSNTTGQSNTANGMQALFLNVTGNNNTAFGANAGYNLVSGDNNIFIGSNAQPTAASVSNQLNIGNWIYGSGGDIGIGYTSPRAALDVKGEIVGLNRLTLTTDGGNTSPTWHIDNHGTGAQDRFRIFRQPNIDTVGSEFLTVLSGGNIGIGTANPNGPLHIEKSNAAYVRVSENNITKALLGDLGSTDHGQLNLYSSTGVLGAVISSANESYFMGGNVGIGTVSPTTKLHIAGNIKIADGTQGAGKVLTSDANGLATWASLGSLGNQVCPGTGANNTCYGIGAMSGNTTGANNTANGYQTLFLNTTGFQNTAVGVNALYSNITGYNNTANGLNALYSNTTGFGNTANGLGSLSLNTTGYNNTANGLNALRSNTTGANNTANGQNSAYFNTTGYGNTANGYVGLIANTSGYFNVANGYAALYSNYTGYYNIAEGTFASYSNVTGSRNTIIGSNAMNNKTPVLMTGSINASTTTRVTLSQALSGVVAGDYVSVASTGSTIASLPSLMQVVNNTTLQILSDYPNLGVTGTATILSVNRLNATDRDNMVAIGSNAGYIRSGGSGTILIGADVDAPDANLPNQLNIGNWIYGSGGYIGIGTATPDFMLDVSEDASFNGVRVGRGSGSVSTNTAVGYQTLRNNTMSGILNTAVGYQALYSNTLGDNNTANGYLALHMNSTGVYNTAAGANALRNNTIGNNNTAYGYTALYMNSTGDANTAIGSNTMRYNTTGYSNSAVGISTMRYNTIGYANTANGYVALAMNLTGSNNVVEGASAFYSNVSGNRNTIIGVNAMNNKTTALMSGSINPSTTTRVTLSQALSGVVAGDYVAVSTTGNTIANLTAIMQVVDNTTLQIPSGFPNLGTSGTAIIQVIYKLNAIDRDDMVVIGTNAGDTKSGGDNTILIGASVDAPDANAPNQLNIGNWIYGSAGNIGIGVLNPGAKLDIAGNIKIADGNQGTGKVLTSDVNGLATWTTVSASNQVCSGTGANNTCYGIGAMSSNTTGYSNTALGVNTLYANTTGYQNTAVGIYALDSNTTGLQNTAVGVNTLTNNTTGNNNTANGVAALLFNTTGSYNTAFGLSALYSNTIGINNTANGANALYSNTTGNNNTANGYNALKNNNIGYNNTANGQSALYSNTTGYNNTADGLNALYSNTTGYQNTALGQSALYSNLTGLQNTANGVQALAMNTTGNNNTSYGVNALYASTTGNNNTALGRSAGQNLVLGDNNIFIGYNTQPNIGTGASNQLNIGNWIYGNGGNIGIGVLNPGAKLEVAGQIKITGGTPGLGKVLTSDANGLATWSSILSGATATGIVGGTQNYVPKFGTGGTGLYSSQLFDNGTNIGIGTSSPSYKLDVYGNGRFNGNLTVSGSLIVDKLVNRTVNNISISGSILPDAMAPLAYRDIGSNAQRWNNLYLSGQVTIAGGSPGLGKILMSDANGLATWTSTVSGATATGIVGGTQNYIPKFGTGGVGLYLSNIFDNGTNIGIGTATPGAKLDVSGDALINAVRVGHGNGSYVENTVLGQSALSNTTGTGNTAVGFGSLYPNTTGYSNTAMGMNALYLNTTGYSNTALGRSSLYSNTTGYNNTANGVGALYYNTTGSTNTAIGVNVLRSNTIGYQNTAVGANSLYANTTGYQNAALGQSALDSNTTGYQNTANGVQSLFSNTTGNNNTAYGVNALYASTTGNNNLALGRSAGSTLISGNNNVFIGYNVQPNIGTGASNQLNIGNWIYGDGGNIGIGASSPSTKLEVAGQIKITGGTPGLGKVLTSDANGLATWSAVLSGATATGIVGGTQNYVPKFGTGGTGLYSSVIYQNGTNIAIGTGTATAKLTLDSGLANISGIRLTRLTATSPTYTGTAVGIGIDSSGNLVPVSNGDVVVYDGIGRNGTTPSPNPDVPNREISYDFNKYFLIPTKQSFVVSDGNGAGYNAPYFKEDGVSGLCSWNGAGGTSPYDCGTADPYTGLSASPNNSFTMTARGTSYGYQIALGARGDAPLFARSGKWYNSTSNYGSGLYLSDGVTPTPWQKVLTVPANHIEYFYVNIGYNSQLQAISGGGNIGMGTSTPDMRLVLAYSGSTGSTSEMMRIERGLKGADANMITTFGTPYLLIGGKETRTNSIQTIGFGYNSASSYQPAEIGLVTTNTAGNTQGDLVFATRSGTTNVTPTERMRIFGNGSIGIGTTTVASRFEVWSGATTIFHMRGTNNIGMGIGSVRSLLSGNANTGFGNESLYTLTTGYSNSAFGHQALRQSTTGYNNSAFGKEAMYNDGDGTWNTALGYQALRSASSSDYNVAIGGQTLYTLGTGTGNIAIGHNALYGATTSTSNNIAIGYQAGSGITTGWNNIVIGNAAQALTSTGSNQLNIGNWIYGNGGNIGVGVSNPTAKLEVAGLIKSTLNGVAFLQGGDDSTLNDVNMANTLGIMGVQNPLVGSLQLGSNTGTYIYGNGTNIGIGTTIPGAKLDVNGTFKLGAAGTATTAAGTCTIAAAAISTTATAYTCTGIPASTSVALNCSAAAAFTTPGTTALYCRANGTANSVTCNTTVANAVSTTYKCMWMQ